jgi:hypothetical protein
MLLFCVASGTDGQRSHSSVRGINVEGLSSPQENIRITEAKHALRKSFRGLMPSTSGSPGEDAQNRCELREAGGAA